MLHSEVSKYKVPSNNLFQICTWNESKQYEREYEQIRTNCLLQECELVDVMDTQVDKLAMYYKAQLCWALALLLEPRVRDVGIFHQLITSYIQFLIQAKSSITSCEEPHSLHERRATQQAVQILELDTSLIASITTRAL